MTRLSTNGPAQISQDKRGHGGIELQARAGMPAAPPAADTIEDTSPEDCNFDADSFRVVHTRLDGPVPAQVHLGSQDEVVRHPHCSVLTQLPCRRRERAVYRSGISDSKIASSFVRVG